jgi:cytochrome c oxidase cbb3-type subunit 1
MFGVFGFWMLGLLVHLLPRVCGKIGWYSRSLNEWHFWITAISMVVMFFDLTIAGLVQGYMWRDLAAWEETIRASSPYWLVRTVSGTAIIVAQFIFAYNVVRTLAMKPGAVGESAEDLQPVVKGGEGLAPA